MDELLSILRPTHVVVGCIGLIVFWVPVIAEKGSPAHRRAGRLFALCALYAGGTGLGLSIWAVLHPASFFGDPQMQRIRAEDVPLAIEKARFLYSITGFLALAVLSGVVFGARLARTHRNPAQLISPPLISVLGIYGLWSIALVMYGGWSIIAIHRGEHVMAEVGGGQYWVSIILGVIGICGVHSDLRHVRRPPSSPSGWVPKHMECMLGAGIGFHAAALFFSVNEWSGLELRGAMRFAPMLVPFVVGVPVMWWSIARWERKASDQGHDGP